MKCNHGKRVNAVRCLTSCPHCSAIVEDNGKTLDLLFKNRVNSLRKLLATLMNEATLQELTLSKGRKHQFWVVEKVSSHLSGISEKVWFELLKEFRDPQVIFHDSNRDLIFVFNPLKEKQNWGLLKRSWRFSGELEKDGSDKRQQVKEQAQQVLAGDAKAIESLYAVPLKEIMPLRGGQSRTKDSPGFLPAKLRELGESIKENGQKVPAILRLMKKPKGTVRYELLGGERRWRACEAVGLPTLLARVLPASLSDRVALSVNLIENANREDLTLMELARFADILLRDGWTIEEIASHSGKTKGRIYQLLPLNRLPKEVQDLMIRYPDKLPVSQALKLLDLKDETDMINAANKWVCLKKQLSAESKRVSREWQRSGAVREGLRSAPLVISPIKSILQTVLDAPTKDGISAEQAKFEQDMASFLRSAPNFLEMLAEAFARSTYFKDWVKYFPENARQLLLWLEWMEGRSARLKDVLEQLLHKN